MTSVLIVDDGGSDRDLLASILRYSGHVLVKADSGDQALRLAREREPDVIIADILTQTVDGYELVRALRSDERTARIPVIFHTTAYMIDEVRGLAAACGVAHILIKPCQPGDVLRVVNEALSRRHEAVAPLPSEDFYREHLRVLTTKLLQKVEELREAVILATALQRNSEARGVEQAARATDYWPTLTSDARLAALSPRELEVLGMIVEGSTNGEIAERLVIATSTVQTHVKGILHKLGVKNRTEAAVRYVRR